MMPTQQGTYDAVPLGTHATRGAVVRSALRAMLTTGTLVYLYFVMPLTGAADVGTVVLLGAGILAFVAMLGWQVRSVASSRTPGLRALEVLATAVPFLLLLFAATYFVISENDGDAFTQPMTRLDALYFTMTVFATVGFGDITGRTEAARAVVTVQMLVDLLVVGVGLRLLLSAVQLGISRRGGTRPSAREPAEPDAQMPRRADSSRR
jgi:hypothetical protein